MAESLDSIAGEYKNPGAAEPISSGRLFGQRSHFSTWAATLWLLAPIFLVGALWATDLTSVQRFFPLAISSAPLLVLLASVVYLWWARVKSPDRGTGPSVRGAKILRIVSAGAVAMLVVLVPLWLSLIPPEPLVVELAGDLVACVEKFGGPGVAVAQDSCSSILAEASQASAERFAALSILTIAFLLALGTGAQSMRLIQIEGRHADQFEISTAAALERLTVAADRSLLTVESIVSRVDQIGSRLDRENNSVLSSAERRDVALDWLRDESHRSSGRYARLLRRTARRVQRDGPRRR